LGFFGVPLFSGGVYTGFGATLAPHEKLDKLILLKAFLTADIGLSYLLKANFLFLKIKKKTVQQKFSLRQSTKKFFLCKTFVQKLDVTNDKLHVPRVTNCPRQEVRNSNSLYKILIIREVQLLLPLRLCYCQCCQQKHREIDELDEYWLIAHWVSQSLLADL